MKYIISLFAFLFFGCASTSSITCPPPTIDSVVTVKTVYVNVPVYDTVRTVKTTVVVDTQLVAINVDTAKHVIRLAPIPYPGDSYPEIQAAINFQQSHGGYKIAPEAGSYYNYHPPFAYSIVGNDYGQAYLDIEGPADAMSTPVGQVADFIAMYDDGFGIGVQQCKGCTIKNIQFTGRYIKGSGLTLLQVDTLPLSGWHDGVHSFNRTAVYAGVAIDPADDPAYHYDSSYGFYPGVTYFPGANRAGSTGVTVTGCAMFNWVVGFIVGPSHQWNGEMINLTHSQLSYNAFAYAFTQAQSKVNLAEDLMVWGQTYCIFDGMRFGNPSSDGTICPMIDGMNIAGYNHELIEHRANSFPVTIKRVYAEGLFMLGELYAGMGANLQDLQVDFQQPSFANAPNVPSPGVVFAGQGVTFNNCAFRMYVGNSQWNRLSFFGYNLFFNNGAFGCPPVMGNIVDGQASIGPPRFSNVMSYYAGGLMNGLDTWDSPLYIGTLKLHYNPSNFTGYVLGADTTKLTPNDMLVTQWHTGAYFQSVVDNYCVGYVDHFHGDSTFLTLVGYGLTNDSAYRLFDDKLIFKQ